MSISGRAEDGRKDLILCCAGFGAASRLVTAIGNGDGTFQAPVESVPATGAFALVDWNGDGLADIVTATPSGTATIALGQKGGMFEVTRTVTAATQVVVARDFTGDQVPDVLLLTAQRRCCPPRAARRIAGNGYCYRAAVFEPQDSSGSGFQ